MFCLLIILRRIKTKKKGGRGEGKPGVDNTNLFARSVNCL